MRRACIHFLVSRRPFKRVCLCIVCILTRLHLNMQDRCIKLCVFLYPCAQTGTPVGEYRGGDGRFQMPLRRRRAGGAAYKWHVFEGRQEVWGEIITGVHVGAATAAWERASLASCVPICARDCVCVNRAFVPNLLCVARAAAPKNDSHLCRVDLPGNTALHFLLVYLFKMSKWWKNGGDKNWFTRWIPFIRAFRA